MKTRSQSIKCTDVAQLLRQSSPEFPRSPAPSASDRSKPIVDDDSRMNLELIITEINHLLTPTVIDSPQIYEVDIDFDDASAAWRMNKKSTGGGCYKYICEAKTQLGNHCLREPMLGCTYCKTHNKSIPSASAYRI